VTAQRHDFRPLQDQHMRGTGAVAYGAIVAMVSLLAAVSSLVAGTTSAEVLKDERTSLSVSGGTLHGSLLVPPGSAPVPIALLISGSGPTDRDGNTPLLPGKNDSLKLLAEGLAARNLASLRYDKRGIGESVGAGRNESRLRFENYIDDAAAWGQRLRKDKRFSSLVIVGHSEGSLIGAVAAQKIPADAFVSLEGVGQPAADLILAQLRPKLSPNTMAAVEGLVAKLKAGQTGMVPTGLEALFRPGVQPYLISWTGEQVTNAGADHAGNHRYANCASGCNTTRQRQSEGESCNSRRYESRPKACAP